MKCRKTVFFSVINAKKYNACQAFEIRPWFFFNFLSTLHTDLLFLSCTPASERLSLLFNYLYWCLSFGKWMPYPCWSSHHDQSLCNWFTKLQIWTIAFAWIFLTCNISIAKCTICNLGGTFYCLELCHTYRPS